ncbi:hypothetical protein DQ239_07885 [Blastococcus sp. TF02-09]|uniref:Na+/H+ antiporter subunit E n=1 Tax=Blastococcus sp. TF02-09 TaxID=2250576 RepID=UPI000DE8125C|nr:Na+/H+ antiporter subunit E [Blastococcus sp. TF02-9]RBY78478.1 hypothetical protein DQ239_07885 [Blastococcus sp. TF02-9]
MTDRIALTVWLFVVWVLLWGVLTPAVLLSGLVVAPLCLALCRLPAVRLTSRPRLGPSLRALGRFAVEVVTTSAQVAWTVVRRGPATRSAIIELKLPASTDPHPDLLVSTVANRLSLVPGTLVVDIDRPSDTLYVYVFDVRSEQDLTVARLAAARAVDDVLAAVGHQSADREESR